MGEGPDIRELGERIERAASRIATASAEVRADAEELVRAVTDLYAAGLARVLDIVRADPAIEAAVLDDPLLTGLLVVSGLHPLPVETRVQRALEGVGPALAARGVTARLVSVDEAAGLARLAVAGEDATAASSVTRAVLGAAPELTRVELDPVARPVPVRLRRSGAATAPTARSLP
jgi:hypothetical protein